MVIKVNTKLLAIKAHYFFFFGGTAPLLPFMSVYAKQLGISEVGVGLMYAVLPFAGVVTKPLFGLLADRFQKKKMFFLLFIVGTCISYLGISLVPDLPQRTDVTVDCGKESFMKMCDVQDQCAADRLSNEGNNTTSRCEFSCHVHSDLTNFDMCITKTSPPPRFCHQIIGRTSATVHNHPVSTANPPVKTSHFSKDAPDMKPDAGLTFSHEEVDAHLIFLSDLNLNRVLMEHSCIYIPVVNVTLKEDRMTYPLYCHTSQPLHCQVQCDHAEIMQLVKVPEMSGDDLYLTYQFWLFFILLIINWSCIGAVTSVGDAICFEMIGEHHELYGKQRVWGAIGWGLFATLAGVLINVASFGKFEKDYSPSFYLMLGLLTIDLVVASRLQFSEHKSSPSILRDVGKLACNPIISVFLLWCVVTGMCAGMLWQFLFWYLENLASVEGCAATEYVKLLQGLVMGVQCFLGEVPFLFASGWLLKKMGHHNAMSMVLGIFGFRFIMYSFITNPWHCLPLEILNGLTLGILFATMTSYASIISPPGTEATMQGVVGAAFEGLGVAAGSFVGSLLFHAYGGARAFLYFGLGATTLTVFHICIHWMMKGRHTYETANQDGNGSLSPRFVNGIENEMACIPLRTDGQEEEDPNDDLQFQQRRLS